MTGGDDSIMRESMEITTGCVGAGVQNLLMQKSQVNAPRKAVPTIRKLLIDCTELKRRIVANDEPEPTLTPQLYCV